MNNQLFTPDSPVDGGQTPESVSVSHEDSNNEDDDDEIL